MNTPQRFEIKQELLPTRCDVCHQADLFDPKTEICRRCQGTIPARLVIVSPPRLSPLPPLPATLSRLEYAPLAPGQASRLTYRDVVAVWTEVVRLYFQHFRVFCGWPALIEIPRFLAFFVVGQVFHPRHQPFDLMYVLGALLICLVPLPELSRGVVVWVVHNILSNQRPQSCNVLQKAAANQWASAWTVWKKEIPNRFVILWILVFGIASISFLCQIIHLNPMLASCLALIFITGGISLAETMFHGLLTPVAFLEGDSYQVMAQRSQWLTMRNLLCLTPLEFLRRSAIISVGVLFLLFQSANWGPGAVRESLGDTLISCIVLPPVMWMNVAHYFPLLFGLLLTLKLLLSPVLTIAQTLFYMLLRARAEAPRGIEQPLSDTILS